ncbi:GntR family transcriptional regulator [Uliginosibacterium sp. H3]|uniref:GntR family transcriptional regulator n=1 Tax=Uliginosibacterium silvisoli TaxID=3114758 RepID=A0ABU6JY33_9RHOO|nr:GntR family transcriptional regulator [Uliginosibacterium sp. H3]
MNAESADSEAASLTDGDIYERIVDAVLDHRLAPGTKLVEEKLGRAFGVSRTRIRQVLVRLASEQLVVLTPNRGASVACPTPEEAREVFGARLLIEPTLVETFMGVANARDLSVLSRLISEEEAARRNDKRRVAIRLSGDFHLLIAERAANRTLEKMLRELVSRTSLILMTYGNVSSHMPGCGCDDHRALLDAMSARDASSAKRLMKQHLKQLERAIRFVPDDAHSDDIEDIFATG